MSNSDDKRELFASIEPADSLHLKVSFGHEIYVERCGNPNGLPIVFLHGGPGGGCKVDHRRYFDPAIYNIILVDQRGSGRSRPYGEVEGNTTQLLIEDLETIRCYFHLEKWSLFAGSWGVALALAYGQMYPSRVSGMVLRGTFLGRDDNVEWFFGNGANRFLPEEWSEFVREMDFGITKPIRDQLYDKIFSKNNKLVEKTARAWEKWSGAVVMFSLKSAGVGISNNASESAIAKARIEFHYAKNHYFLSPNQLLLNASSIPDIPIYIVHGSRDLTCLPENAWSLHKSLPSSSIEFLHNAGHLGSEQDMIDALVRATESLSNDLK
jgi:proline iminopeptidase